MLVRSTLLALVLLAPHVAEAKPNIGLKTALKRAEAYVRKNHIPNSGRYLASVAWHEDFARPEKSCWTVAWESIELMTDAQLVVRVCADGSIRHQDSWA